jgi:hypothetical protein
MQKETEELAKGPRAFTLVELILVTGTVALVTGVLVGLVSNGYGDFKFGSARSTLLQDGQSAIEQIVRILRQAASFSAVSSPTDQAGNLTYSSVDGVAEQFRLNTATNELEYGPPGSLSALTGSVSSLVFTCYDINGNALTAPVQVTRIQSVQVEVTLVDPQDSSIGFTLTGRAFNPRDFSSIVVNEFMYDPSVPQEDNYEWVELYNPAAFAVDLTGWTVHTDNPSQPETLIAHPQFGNGSMSIPASGYAVMTARITEVYQEQLQGGSFESSGKFRNDWEKSNWDSTKFNAHNGTWKAESSANGSAWLYQDVTIPSGFNSCLLLFWESTTAPVAQTQITVTIRDLSDQVLATGYSGQFNTNWTYHGMDIGAYAGQSIRIHLATTKSTTQGVLLLDDVSAATSFVNLNATRISTGDGQISNGLANTNGTVAVTDGGSAIDSVTYSNSWGGSGDGTSLARIDPQGGSNDPANWQSGPTNGSPGSAN